MLSPREAKYLRDNLYSSDHDYFFWSGLLGEPFLDSDVLYYFDGETLTINGYTLNRSLADAEVADALVSMVHKWQCRSDVTIINYYGPVRLDPPHDSMHPFRQVYAGEPQPYNVDMRIDLSDPSVLNTRNAKESTRKAYRRGIEVLVRDARSFGYQHITLIRKLAFRPPLSLSDASYLTGVVSILKDIHTTIFDATVTSKLVAFAVAHEFFTGNPFLVIVCSDRSFVGASDALYAAVIKHYLACGSRWLGLGYSAHHSLFTYKMKWGGVHCNRPFYQSIWTREPADGRLLDCLHWVCRLLITKCNSS